MRMDVDPAEKVFDVEESEEFGLRLVLDPLWDWDVRMKSIQGPNRSMGRSRCSFEHNSLAYGSLVIALPL